MKETLKSLFGEETMMCCISGYRPRREQLQSFVTTFFRKKKKPEHHTCNSENTERFLYHSSIKGFASLAERPLSRMLLPQDPGLGEKFFVLKNFVIVYCKCQRFSFFLFSFRSLFLYHTKFCLYFIICYPAACPTTLIMLT